MEANKQKRNYMFRAQNTRDSRRRRGEFDVKNDEKVTEMFTIEIQRKRWSKKMGDKKQSSPAVEEVLMITRIFHNVLSQLWLTR